MNPPIKPEKPEKYWSRPTKPLPHYIQSIFLFDFKQMHKKTIEDIIQKLSQLRKDNPEEELICIDQCIYKQIKVEKSKQLIAKEEKIYQRDLDWYKNERNEYVQNMKKYKTKMNRYEKDLAAYEKYDIQRQVEELRDKASQFGLIIKK